MVLLRVTCTFKENGSRTKVQVEFGDGGHDFVLLEFFAAGEAESLRALAAGGGAGRDRLWLRG